MNLLYHVELVRFSNSLYCIKVLDQTANCIAGKISLEPENLNKQLKAHASPTPLFCLIMKVHSCCNSNCNCNKLAIINNFKLLIMVTLIQYFTLFYIIPTLTMISIYS